MPTPVVIDGGVSITSDAQRKLIEVVKRANFPFTVRVTSASRSEPGSYHDRASALAVDFAVGHGMNDDNSRKMREVARLFRRFPTQLKELIHSTPFSDDNGFYVSNGQVVSAGYFNEPGPHLNHIHVAATVAGADQILRTLTPAPAPTPAPKPTPVPPASDLPVGETKKLNDILMKDAHNSVLMKLVKEVRANHKKTLELLEAKVGIRTYTVKANDTLTKIALAHDTTVSELVRVNNLSDPDTISVGQVLKLP